MSKVFITGSSGFIGSHICDALESKGHEVILYDIISSKYKSESQKEVLGSILDYEKMYNAIEDCDIIYHLAAQADIGQSSIDPSNTLRINIQGTQNILDIAIKKKISRIIFASTIYVYSDLGSFYRVSKQACEKIIEEYQREFGLDFTILRFGSLYGPRANEFNFILNAITQALRQKKIFRRGDGEEIREYIHVKDAAQLSVEALNERYRNEHLILTGHQQTRIKDLLKIIAEIFDNDIQIEFGKEKELHHYEITPYNFKPRIAKKITCQTYYDLGQGILDQVYDLQNKLHQKGSPPIISLRNLK